MNLHTSDDEFANFIKENQIVRKKLPRSLNKSLDSSVPFLQIFKKQKKHCVQKDPSMILEEVRQ